MSDTSISAEGGGVFNWSLGESCIIDGATAIATRSRSGHALFGPYQSFDRGQYEVCFKLRVLEEVVADRLVAFLDVVADGTVIAGDVVTARELEMVEGRPFLAFDLQRPAKLEFRVRATGARIGISNEQVVTKRSSSPAAASRLKGSDPEVLRIALENDERLEDLLETLGRSELSPTDTELAVILAPLQPSQARGYAKRRIGSQNDGGYVCLDDLDGIDTVLSLGIDSNVDFDADIAGCGAKIFQFDHTVDAPRPGDPSMIFERKKIGVKRDDTTESLPTLIRRHDTGHERRNIFLKIDIENWEWAVFDDIDERDLARLRQITGEFHAFEFAALPLWRERAIRVMEKINRHFALVHVHGNNCAGATLLQNGLVVPNVMELTFVNRHVYELSRSTETFPTSLDNPCDRGRPELRLGAFRF